MKEKRKPGKKKALLFGAGGTALLLGGMAAGYLFVINREEEPVYREETVQYGTLTVGLQETGSVEVGTAEQTFELDMSAYTESGSNSFFIVIIVTNQNEKGKSVRFCRYVLMTQDPGGRRQQ